MIHEIYKDTIIAISTPRGYGGLGIVRISGRRALPVARKIFRTGNRLSIKDHAGKMVFGRLYDFEKKTPIDEGFLTYFKAPRSYTREDVVELSCHGSPVLLDSVLRLGVRAGARAAHPGEFTLRAYRNGRIDMIQAEAVNDLIRAVSPLQVRISYRQLSGSLSRKVRAIRSQILHLAAQIEAAIEFPEEELRIDSGKHARAIERLLRDVETLVASYEAGKIMIDGPVLAIAGRTNVGKSTLFNALLEEQRAIVTPYAGTTRDYLREKMIIGDSAVNLVDMAGLGPAAHPVEKEGVARSRKMAEAADGLLVVLDGSRKESREDVKLIRKFCRKKAIIVVNKNDLLRRIDMSAVRSLTGETPIVEISALRGSGLEALKSRIRELLAIPQDNGEEIIVHVRQRDILREIHEVLGKAACLLKECFPEEIVAEEIQAAIPLVGRLTGEIRAEEVMEDVFSRFCVGK